MSQFIAYLTFDGNCREAMTFYGKCFGGEVVFQTVGESPEADRLPLQMKECVLQATLVSGSIRLMATDMVGDHGLQKGNATSILVDCSSEDELNRYYSRLSEGAGRMFPIQRTYWGALFGGLTDRFGNQWLLNFKNKQE